MKMGEFLHILAAILLFAVVGSLSFAIDSDWAAIPQVLLFSALIIFVSIFAKKLMAHLLDSDVEHEIWRFSRWGIKPHQEFKKEVQFGIILPLVLSVLSLGAIKFSTFLSYEARALRRRAAKRFGPFSYTEMTEWHHAVIGAAGIIAVLLIALIVYFMPFNLEYPAKLAVFYAFSNMLPLPKTDGMQILFGSRVLYTALAVISLIFLAYAIIL